MSSPPSPHSSPPLAIDNDEDGGASTLDEKRHFDGIDDLSDDVFSPESLNASSRDKQVEKAAEQSPFFAAGSSKPAPKTWSSIPTSSIMSEMLPPPRPASVHKKQTIDSVKTQPKSEDGEGEGEDDGERDVDEMDVSQEKPPGSSVEEAVGYPDEELVEFDWEDLERRYHQQIKEFTDAEQQIMSEFEGLCNYFAKWAETGSTHEVERSFKRLKTQKALVQHQESRLDQKRHHYVKVVDAFKSALDLLAD